MEAPTALGHLFHDSVARDVYVERDGLEDRMEGCQQFKDSALLVLRERKLLLEGLR